MPPMYSSTGGRVNGGASVGLSSRISSVKRANHQVNRRRCPWCRSRAARPLRISGTATGATLHAVERFPGMSKETSSGKVTGRSAIGTGTMPQASQWMTGIGQPE